MIVPTVERGLWLVDFCSIAMAGLKPSMESTSGFPFEKGIGGHKQKVILRNDVDLLHTMYQRLEDFPEPEVP